MTFKNHQVLKDCTWEVKKGERVGLVGEQLAVDAVSCMQPAACTSCTQQHVGSSGRHAKYANCNRHPLNNTLAFC